MADERDIDAIASWDHPDGYLARRTGPKREPPGVCPVCGEDVPDRPFFGDATCGKAECREAVIRR